jgi:hypothetical protein
MTLIVSLPRNDPGLAQEVQRAGADAIKVHLNCHHRASGTLFGTWAEERGRIEKIPQDLDIPVGIVPGADVAASMEEMDELTECGFDFLDIFAHHMPCPYFTVEKLTKVIAIDYTFPFEHIAFLEEAGMEVIEASIIEPQGYGKALSVRDLVKYRDLMTTAKRPVFIPTQRKITPEDIPFIHKIGARGIAIGAIVTGMENEGIIAATRRFRKAIDEVAKKSLTLNR